MKIISVVIYLNQPDIIKLEEIDFLGISVSREEPSLIEMSDEQFEKFVLANNLQERIVEDQYDISVRNVFRSCQHPDNLGLEVGFNFFTSLEEYDEWVDRGWEASEYDEMYSEE